MEASAVDHDAADGDPMATDELGGRVVDDVGPVLEGAEEIRSGEGVVHEDRHPAFMRDRRHRGEVRHLTAWVAECLGENQPRVIGDGGLPGVKVVVVHPGGRDPEPGAACA